MLQLYRIDYIIRNTILFHTIFSYLCLNFSKSCFAYLASSPLLLSTFSFFSLNFSLFSSNDAVFSVSSFGFGPEISLSSEVALLNWYDYSE